MILYELHCKVTLASLLLGKTKRYLKEWTMEHAHSVWKIIETGRNELGGNAWYGSGEYKRQTPLPKTLPKTLPRMQQL